MPLRHKTPRRKNRFVFFVIVSLVFACALAASAFAQDDSAAGFVPGITPATPPPEPAADAPAPPPEMQDFPVVRLRSLDKVTARTMTFEADVGSTLRFGSIYIKVQACRKAPPIETPESAAFLQVWEVAPDDQAQWVFSGWMFASSPGLSAMDHPIYDVWVLDCLEKKGPKDAAAKKEEQQRGEGEVEEEKIQSKPDAAMEQKPGDTVPPARPAQPPSETPGETPAEKPAAAPAETTDDIIKRLLEKDLPADQ